MQEVSDIIVIGSGPSGAHAAVPLVEAGLQVLMLDGGSVPSTTAPDAGGKTFNDIRTSDPEQWKIFLGEDLSAIPVGGLEGGLGGGMVSGNRSYVLRGANEELPLDVRNGLVMESLAKGGLGAVWGAACAFFSAEDLRVMGLPAEEIAKHYDAVSTLIGISGPHTHPNIQAALPLDHHAEKVMKKATKKHKKLDAMHLRIMQPHSAVLTADREGRQASTLTDMDYYSDRGRSIYRPQYTIEDLQTKPNFHYNGGIIVDRLEETPDGVVVFAHRMGDRSTTLRWTARRVIVAAGAVNTARILLRTFDLFDVPVPFIAKPHVYTACLQPSTIGMAGPQRRSSLCQLLVIDEEKTPEGFSAGCAQLYSYRSLLLFRLLGNIPFLPVPETMGLLSMLSAGLVVADIRFPAIALDGHTLQLHRDTDRIEIICKNDMNDMRRASLKRLHKGMRMTGLLPLKTSRMPPASTSHHGGTVPVEDGRNLPLSVTPDGKVTRAKNIYVADASMFSSIPALPYTLTIMANARRVGEIVKSTL